MPSDLDTRFNQAMVDIYVTAKLECAYNATRFFGMIAELGGLDAARRLIHSECESDGYRKLWSRGRLDLTVEALILEPEWAELFTDDDRAKARGRLEQFGYTMTSQAPG
jgi:hypothetical protein